MKKELFELLHQAMRDNPDMYVIFIDLGFNYVDGFLQEFPERAFTVGASEQTALDIAVGLSYAGKLPVVYTISTFYWRCAETLRTYINHENLRCVLIGAGRDEEYGEHDGFSHSATDIPKLFDLFPRIVPCYPETNEALKRIFDLIATVWDDKPVFINIHR